MGKQTKAADKADKKIMAEAPVTDGFAATLVGKSVEELTAIALEKHANVMAHEATIEEQGSALVKAMKSNSSLSKDAVKDKPTVELEVTDEDGKKVKKTFVINHKRMIVEKAEYTAEELSKKTELCQRLLDKKSPIFGEGG